MLTIFIWIFKIDCANNFYYINYKYNGFHFVETNFDYKKNL